MSTISSTQDLPYELLRAEPESNGLLDRVPWLPSLYLFACFFLTIHDFQASTWNINRPADFFASTSGSGSVQTKLAFIMLGAYGTIGWVRRRTPKLAGDGVGALCALAFLAWTMLSFIWADNHAEPLGRLAGVAALTLTALHLRRTYSGDALVRWITLSTFGWIVLGVVTELALHTLTPWQYDYRFSGTLHPNAQGINCSIALLGACCFAFYSQRRRWWIGVAATALLFDVLTRSRTAIFSLLIATVLAALVTRRGRFANWLTASALSSLVLLGLWISKTGILSFGGVLQFGRDQNTSDNGSLTGRVPLWAELMKTINQRPVVGQGYGAYWTANHIERISSDQGWGISAAHSAYVDVLLALGIVGLVLYAFMVIAGAFKARRVWLDRPHVSTTFFGIMMFFVLVDGVTDSEPVIVSAFLSFCFILAIMAVLVRSRSELTRVSTPD